MLWSIGADMIDPCGRTVCSTQGISAPENPLRSAWTAFVTDWGIPPNWVLCANVWLTLQTNAKDKRTVDCFTTYASHRSRRGPSRHSAFPASLRGHRFGGRTGVS